MSKNKNKSNNNISKGLQPAVTGLVYDTHLPQFSDAGAVTRL